MTRKDQMLKEFDDLATAELDDIAAPVNGMFARAATARPAVQPPQAAAKLSGWDWLVGIGAISLVLLAARR